MVSGYGFLKTSKIYIRYKRIYCMYNDDKTWKQHFDDWVKIIDQAKRGEDITPSQHEYRMKTIKKMIDSYKASIK